MAHGKPIRGTGKPQKNVPMPSVKKGTAKQKGTWPYHPLKGNKVS